MATFISFPRAVSRIRCPQKPSIRRVSPVQCNIAFRVGFRAVADLPVAVALLALAAMAASATTGEDLSDEVAAERHIDPRVAAAVETGQQDAHHEQVGYNGEGMLVIMAFARCRHCRGRKIKRKFRYRLDDDGVDDDDDDTGTNTFATTTPSLASDSYSIILHLCG